MLELELEHGQELSAWAKQNSTDLSPSYTPQMCKQTARSVFCQTDSLQSTQPCTNTYPYTHTLALPYLSLLSNTYLYTHALALPYLSSHACTNETPAGSARSPALCPHRQTLSTRNGACGNTLRQRAHMERMSSWMSVCL